MTAHRSTNCCAGLWVPVREWGWTVWWCSGPGHIPSFQLCPAEDTTALLACCILQGESEEKANFPFQGSAGSSVEGDSYLFIPPADSNANEPFISRLT